jgi:hypothetical protein
MKKLILFLLLAAVFPARAQIITASITVTNQAGTTNGNTLVIDGSTRTFTNLFLLPSTQVQMGTNIVFAASNLFLDFAESPISGAMASWNKANTVILQSFPGSALSVSLGAGWGILATSTTTIGTPETVLRLPISGVGPNERTNMETFMVALLNDTAATAVISASAPIFANFLPGSQLVPGFGIDTNITEVGTILSVDTNQLANFVDMLIPAYIGGEQYPWGMIPNMTWTNAPYGLASASGNFVSPGSSTNAWGAFSTNQLAVGFDFNGGTNIVTYTFPASVTVSNTILGCFTPLNNSVQVTLKGSPDGVTWTTLATGSETNLNNYPIAITNTFSAFSGKYFSWIITNSAAGILMGGNSDWNDEGQQIGPVPNIQLGGANSTIVITGVTPDIVSNIVDNEGSTKFLPIGPQGNLDATNLTVFDNTFLNDSNIDVFWTAPQTNFQGGQYAWGLIPPMTWDNTPSGYAYLRGAFPNTTNAWAAFTTNIVSASLLLSPSANAILGYSFSSPQTIIGQGIGFSDYEQLQASVTFQGSADSNTWTTLGQFNGFATWPGGGMTNFFAGFTGQYFRWLITNASPDFSLGNNGDLPVAQLYGIPQYPSPVNSGVDTISSSPSTIISIQSSNGVSINGPAVLGFDLTAPSISAQSATISSLNVSGLNLNGSPVNLSSLISTPTGVIGTNFTGIATNFNGPFTWDMTSNYFTNNLSGWQLVPWWNTNFASSFRPISGSWFAVTNLATFASNFTLSQVFSPFNPDYGLVPNGMYPYYIGSLVGNWYPGRYWAPNETVINDLSVISGIEIGLTISSTENGFISPSGINGTLPYTIMSAVQPVGLTTNITLSGGATLYITNGLVQAYH